ncbi:MAG: patatin-like phospholipase family protein [Moraxellaceae bacterium]
MLSKMTGLLMRQKKNFLQFPLLMMSMIGAATGAETAVSDTQTAEGTGAKRQKTAIVLSGGGARGLAHVGVFKALEKMRVPYDCIVGTSMGAIAGGSFATGISTAEAEKKVVEADWRAVFSDKPTRSDIPYFRKYEDYKPYFDFTLTLEDYRLKTPRNFVGVQNIGLFFRELTGAESAKNFDDLPTPYRAIGTDIIDGEAIVMSDGTVAEAMRASMTVPGIFPPISYKGHMLVDGGLSKNMPVSVGRELCGPGSRVIAVNVSTPGLKQADLTSFLSIGEQTINISMQRNMNEEVANLGKQDILLTPKLEGYTSADFEKVKDLIKVGEDIVLEHADALASFQVSEADYAVWRAAIEARKKPDPIITSVKMTDMHWVNPEVMQDLLNVKTGQPFDMKALHANIDKVYARGDFSSISYDLINDDKGNAELLVHPQEKDGRDAVRFGLSLYSDFQGESSFNALATLRRGWLNRLGAEWRTDVQVGEDTGVYSEWYQPATLSSAFFVAPYAIYTDQHRDVYLESFAKLRYQFTRFGGGVELGSVFGRWGEVRVGAVRAQARAQSETLFVVPDETYQQGGFTLRTIYDQLDNTHFPHDGSSVRLNVFSSSSGMGADEDYERLDFRALKAFTRSRNTVMATVRVGSDMNTELPYYEAFTLGGIFNLSAYPPGSLMGGKLGYASLLSYRRFSDLPRGLGRGIYGGVQLEGARIGHVPDGFTENGTAVSVSAYLAADTVLGPFYLLGALGDDDQSAIYMALGISF